MRKNVRGRADANGLKMTLFAAFLRRSAPTEAEGGGATEANRMLVGCSRMHYVWYGTNDDGDGRGRRAR